MRVKTVGAVAYGTAVIGVSCVITLWVSTEHPAPEPPAPPELSSSFMEFYTGTIQRHEMAPDHCGDTVLALLVPCDVRGP